MFAKPFVGALEGAQDGVYCLARDSRRVGVVAAGGGDGEVIIHSLSLRRPILKLPQAHKGMVSALCWTAHQSDIKRSLLSSSSMDMSIKLWSSPFLSSHLSGVVGGGVGDDDGTGYEGNAFGSKAEKSAGEMMDDDQRALGEGMGGDMDDDEDDEGMGGFRDEEGGGLRTDDKLREKEMAKVEPLMVYQGKHGFK